jgi:hypothetical protein
MQVPILSTQGFKQWSSLGRELLQGEPEPELRAPERFKLDLFWVK